MCGFSASGAIDTVELCGLTVSRATSHLGSIAATLGAFGVRVHTDMAPPALPVEGVGLCGESRVAYGIPGPGTRVLRPL
jgi:hypothetical protein